MSHSDDMTLKGTLEKREAQKKRNSAPHFFSQPARWILIAVLILSPWFFGSIQHWPQQWISGALLICLGLWWFETAMDSGERQILPYLGLFVLTGLIWGILQILPMPDGVGGWVLGRQTEIWQQFSGEPPASVKASLNPEETWGQIRLLMIGLVGLLLGCRYFRSTRDLVTLLTVCTANGVLMSFFGMIQKLTWKGEMFWFYTIERGTPFGPFVNRNNGAGYLLMCLACCIGLIPIVMANRRGKGPVQIISKEMPIWRQYQFYFADFISELTAPKLAVLFSAGLIGAGIVGSLSRGGVSAMLLAGIVTILFYGMARRTKNFSLLLLPIVLIIAGLATWVGFYNQLMARIDTLDVRGISDENLRLQNWQNTWPAVSEMGLMGSGLGSYRQVHRFYSAEPETRLYAYAENQFFQALVEAGWVGLILFCLAWVMAFWYALFLLYRGQSATSVGVGTFAIFLLVAVGTSACFDFGMYLPANTLLMSVLVGFLAFHAHSLGARLKKKNWLRFDVPNRLVQFLLLSLFAGMTLVTIDLYRRASQDREMTLVTSKLSYDSLSLSDLDSKIKNMNELVQRLPSIEGLNYVGELFILRARLMFHETIQADDDFKNAALLLAPDERKTLLADAWKMTSLMQIHENVQFLKRNISRYQATRFLNSPFVQDNLPLATYFFEHSRRLAPLQPVVHLRLGQLTGTLQATGKGEQDVEQAILLAPKNPEYRKLAALFYLYEGQPEKAAVHLKAYLQLSPKQFNPLMQLLSGKTVARIEVFNRKKLVDLILPDNPQMLFEFAQKWGMNDPQAVEMALVKADSILKDRKSARTPDLLLHAEIQLAKGDTDEAIASMLQALKNNPLDLKTQLRVINLLEQQGRLEDALFEARKLLSHDRSSKVYNELIFSIEGKIENLKDHRK